MTHFLISFLPTEAKYLTAIRVSGWGLGARVGGGVRDFSNVFIHSLLLQHLIELRQTGHFSLPLVPMFSPMASSALLQELNCTLLSTFRFPDIWGNLFSVDGFPPMLYQDYYFFYKHVLNSTPKGGLNSWAPVLSCFTVGFAETRECRMLFFAFLLFLPVMSLIF